MSVSYTDVDYLVYTDAARYVCEGLSPYLRHTYRYTPLLAAIMTPNVLVTHSAGKLVLAALDILAAHILASISPQSSAHSLYLIILNPLVFNLSTRGSADIISAILVFYTLLHINKAHTYTAALFYGLAVHFKIYPIIFAPSILLALNTQNNINAKQIKFTVVSASVFAALAYLTYYLYGYEGVFESLLYHLVRKDHRHNFSLYFYHIYLNFGSSASFITALISFVPQMALIIVASFKFSRKDLPFTWFILTMIFVTFNKVVTAQYFLWYISMLPLIMPKLSLSRARLGFLAVIWFISELHWNYWSGYLEGGGKNGFYMIWISTIIFFFNNILIIVQMISGYNFETKKVEQ
jgi:phosphatidylinositol glycan class M